MEPRIHRVIHLMSSGLDRQMLIDELALTVNLSASRLRHLFKEEIGTSIAQYLKARRMERAKALLETTFLDLKEVMSRSGFTDKSHFVRDFKKAYGLPPSLYRNRHLTSGQKRISRRIAKTANG